MQYYKNIANVVFIANSRSVYYRYFFSPRLDCKGDIYVITFASIAHLKRNSCKSSPTHNSTNSGIGDNTLYTYLHIFYNIS